MPARHIFFDHTGDFGVDIRGDDLDEAVAEVPRAFLDLLTGDVGCVAEREERALEVEGVDLLDALVALGNELLFWFEVDGFLVARFEPDEVEPGWIAGRPLASPSTPSATRSPGRSRPSPTTPPPASRTPRESPCG